MNDYDCANDVISHKLKVGNRLLQWVREINVRAIHHDDSKLRDPMEKAMFDRWTPELRKCAFGSDEYKAALSGMGEGLARHYRANRHHPEHFENGINGMNLIDVIEMVADWEAAASRNNKAVDLDSLQKRFNLSQQLLEIISNTIQIKGAL